MRQAKTLDDVFTREERLRMAYVPLVVTESIWGYINKVLDYCAANRIQELKKLSRAVKALRDDYYSFLRGSIDSDHLAATRACAGAFQETFARDMLIMWLTLNQELKKNYPTAPHIEMRTDALSAILLVRLLKGFCADVDKDITARLDVYASTLNPRLRDLDEIMDAYVGTCEVDRTELVRRCEVILRRAINTIEYKE